MTTIGILGGYGNVGVEVLKVLYKENKYILKAAVRNLEKVSVELREDLAEVEWVEVEIDNSEQLEIFLEEVDIVVNCIGPSAKYSKRIAEKCVNCIEKYVDVGHVKPIDKLIRNNNSLYIYAAGVAPGLSALLCKFIAKRYKFIEKMVYINAMSGSFSSNAAWDYLDGITTKQSYRTESDYMVQGSVGKRRRNVILPFINGVVELIPYYDSETQYLIEDIHPRTALFYVALQGKLIQKSIQQSSILFLREPDRAVRELVRASKLDSIKGNEFLMFLVEMVGVLHNGNRKAYTLVLKTRNPSVLTGGVAGIVTRMIAEDTKNKGIYPLCEYENYTEIIDCVIKLDIIEQFQIYDSDIESLSRVDEGEI